MASPEGSDCSTPQRSASGDDSDSDYENENIRPRGLTGLQNLGNTCYLNSALQSLSNCPPLTQYFLDCAQLIRPEKAPMLSRSYLKLITELWHKKRPSYVVPSGVVSGIKAVHPMFRGCTQQDAQEFLRCLMDQLHEELKVSTTATDHSDSEDENDDGGGSNTGDDMNNANSVGDVAEEATRHHTEQQKISVSYTTAVRRPSFDSISSHSELDYETCDSGLSSERSSTGGERDNVSSDENNSDTNESWKRRRQDRSGRAVVTGPAAATENSDMVANTKEMKETANLLEKKSECESRRPRYKAVMEGGDSREQGSSSPYMPVPAKDGETQSVAPQVLASGGIPAVQKEQSSQCMPQPTVMKPPLKQHAKTRKAKNLKWDSIISQTFDGKILSSVRCLNCETVSTTKETFQDLSLPIPSKDHLYMLHSGHHPAAGGVAPLKGGACGEVHQGWLAWMVSWMKSWFIGPTITLQDCLSAFFSADELKGDNMYSCDKCKKLRNGLKYSKVLELPEILSIHLKRFRHEFYSSKISTYISFPLESLDMEPYLHKECKSEVTLYDLVAIICHHGTAGGGHYTAYCLNHLNEQWYEFDDQYVTEVDVSQVQNCEAYVLFYRKSNQKLESLRQRIMELETSETSILRFYISKQWVCKFHTFAEPGPITNMDFLCKHGGVPPGKVHLIDDLVEEIHQNTWELLHNRFGGGPVCNHLYACKTCRSELDSLRQRQRLEKESFIQLNEEFQEDEHTAAVYAISMAWFKEWEAFVREKSDAAPGPIENTRIIVYKNGQPTLRPSSDHGQLSREMWLFLHRIYGGGPELLIRQSVGAPVKAACSSPTPQSVGAPVKATSSSPTPQQTQGRSGLPPTTTANPSHIHSVSPVPSSIAGLTGGGGGGSFGTTAQSHVAAPSSRPTVSGSASAPALWSKSDSEKLSRPLSPESHARWDSPVHTEVVSEADTGSINQRLTWESSNAQIGGPLGRSQHTGTVLPSYISDEEQAEEQQRSLSSPEAATTCNSSSISVVEGKGLVVGGHATPNSSPAKDCPVDAQDSSMRNLEGRNTTPQDTVPNSEDSGFGADCSSTCDLHSNASIALDSCATAAPQTGIVVPPSKTVAPSAEVNREVLDATLPPTCAEEVGACETIQDVEFKEDMTETLKAAQHNSGSNAAPHGVDSQTVVTGSAAKETKKKLKGQKKNKKGKHMEVTKI